MRPALPGTTAGTTSFASVGTKHEKVAFELEVFSPKNSNNVIAACREYPALNQSNGEKLSTGAAGVIACSEAAVCVRWCKSSSAGMVIIGA